MKTQNKWLLVSMVATLAGVGVAAAQPGGGKDCGAKFDTNGDGTVTTAEFQAGALARFTASDANNDGKVTADEFKAQHEKHKLERFAKEDVNGNGKLERSEVAKMPDVFFAKLDTNKDGSLSKEEMAAGHPKHEGKAEGDKAKRLPGDENQDGVLTKEEAVAGAQKWAAKIDADGDGKLTKEEMQKAHPHHGHGPRGFHKGQGPRPTTDAG
jgi:EF-hand domain pair/EF hand